MDAIMPLPLSDEDVRAQHVCESFLRRACGAPLCSAVDATLSSAADAGYTNVLVGRSGPSPQSFITMVSAHSS